MWLSYPSSYSSIGSITSYTIITNLFLSSPSSRTTTDIRSVTLGEKIPLGRYSKTPIREYPNYLSCPIRLLVRYFYLS